MDPLTIGSARSKRAGRHRPPQAGPGSRPGTAGSSSRRWSWRRSVGDRGLPPASGRIEIADLRERVRKLEAIAAGIDI